MLANNIVKIFINNQQHLCIEVCIDMFNEGDAQFLLHLSNNGLLLAYEIEDCMPEMTITDGISIFFARECMQLFSSPKYNIFKLFEDKKTSVHINSINLDGVSSLFTQIYEYASSSLPEKAVMAATRLAQLLVKLNNECFGMQNIKLYTNAAKDNSKINDIINFITINLHRKITLKELEKKFFINKFYLCHLFKDIVGCTVIDYISECKVSQAKKMLKEGVSPSNVCTQLGFDDYSNFYRLFKKLTGVSPREYQKNRDRI